MGYIIGLFLILGVIFSTTAHNNMVADFSGELWTKTKNKFNSIIFPKTKNEILIENLEEKYNLLDKFFSESAPRLLESEKIPQKDKDLIKEGVILFSESKTLLEALGDIEQEDKSLTRAIIQKALNLIPGSTPIAPDPTHIPPQCRLEC